MESLGTNNINSNTFLFHKLIPSRRLIGVNKCLGGCFSHRTVSSPTGIFVSPITGTTSANGRWRKCLNSEQKWLDFLGRSRLLRALKPTIYDSLRSPPVLWACRESFACVFEPVLRIEQRALLWQWESPRRSFPSSFLSISSPLFAKVFFCATSMTEQHSTFLYGCCNEFHILHSICLGIPNRSVFDPIGISSSLREIEGILVIVLLLSNMFTTYRLTKPP